MSHSLNGSDLVSTKSKFHHNNILYLLDSCKGIAIILIFLLHYYGGFFGWQGVHIFIVLSGFGLTYSCLQKVEAISWKAWLFRRADKIIPAYWLIVLATFFCMCFLRSFGKALTGLKSLVIDLVLDISLVKLFFTGVISTFPNFQLWFVPFIISFYLIFPWLYGLLLKQKKINHIILFLLVTVLVEFFYRFFSIYWLDGNPIAYDAGFDIFFKILNLPISIPSPLQRLPDTFPFQGEAPFGLVLSRIGEFALGMVGAVFFVKNQQLFHSTLINVRTAILGFFIWIFGNFLIYVDLWGWIVADFIIALGLILWIVNLVKYLQDKKTTLFFRLSLLGVYSYSIYLTHCFCIYMFQILESKYLLILDNNFIGIYIVKIAVFVLVIIGTAITSWLIVKFERLKLRSDISGYLYRLIQRL